MRQIKSMVEAKRAREPANKVVRGVVFGVQLSESVRLQHICEFRCKLADKRCSRLQTQTTR